MIELLIVMVLLAGVMALVYEVLVVVQKDTRRIAEREDAVTQTRQALAQIDRQVRSGNVLYSPANEAGVTAGCAASSSEPAGDCMRIFTQSNGDAKCVQWQLTPDASRPGTQLLRTRSWSTSWQTDSQVSAWRTVARGLNNATAAGEWPFALEATSSSSQRVLKVLVYAQPKDESAQRVRLESSLSGRNTHYGFDPGTCTPVPPA